MQSPHPHAIPLKRWLYGVAALVFLMVLVGGATRLTESGLSITEWKPITGALPPLSHEDWAAAFEKYQQSSQFSHFNSSMTIAEFKTIFWWEWSHRLLGRFIGLAMLAPFLLFFAIGWLRGRLAARTFGIGCLIGLQGAVGWLMVASGLVEGMVAVAPLKLMFHLGLAAVIFVCLIWVAMSLNPAEPQPATKWRACVLFLAIFVQVLLGALVAGSRAGFTYNTWPLMDGGFSPPLAVLFARTPWVENFVDTLELVQLNHRLGGYVVLALSLWHWLSVRRLASAYARQAFILLGLVSLQAALGIVTLLLAVPISLALIHQGLAFLVLGKAAYHLQRSA